MQARLERVARSEFVLLLQSDGVLLQPWILLALYTDLNGVPLVCVLAEGSGYDFTAARQQLERLETVLDRAALEEMEAVLSQLSPPSTVTRLQTALVSVLPAIISVEYNPEGGNGAQCDHS